MAIKRFDSKPRQTAPDQAEDLPPLLFILPGSEHVYVATVPKQSIWQRTIISTRANVPEDRKAAAISEFLRGTLAGARDGEHLEDRLTNPADDLDTPNLFPVVSYLSTTWVQIVKDPELRAQHWADYNEFLEHGPAGAPTETEDQAEETGEDAGTEVAVVAAAL